MIRMRYFWFWNEPLLVGGYMFWAISFSKKWFNFSGIKLLCLKVVAFNKIYPNTLFATIAQVDVTKFCIVFPWICFIPAWTHGVRSHSLVVLNSNSNQLFARSCLFSEMTVDCIYVLNFTSLCLPMSEICTVSQLFLIKPQEQVHGGYDKEIAHYHCIDQHTASLGRVTQHRHPREYK